MKEERVFCDICGAETKSNRTLSFSNLTGSIPETRYYSEIDICNNCYSRLVDKINSIRKESNYERKPNDK